MTRPNENDVVEEATEEKDTKWITASLSKTDDAEIIKKYNRLVKIGNFSNREVLEAGVKSLVESDQYQDALKAIKEDMDM